MYPSIPTAIIPPPGRTPGNLTFQKKFGQIPHCAGENHRQIPQGAGKNLMCICVFVLKEHIIDHHKLILT
jgi:hypothetical protein